MLVVTDSSSLMGWLNGIAPVCGPILACKVAMSSYAVCMVITQTQGCTQLGKISGRKSCASVNCHGSTIQFLDL